MVFWLLVWNMFFSFSIQLGISLSQLTNSHFSEVLKSPTRYGDEIFVASDWASSKWLFGYIGYSHASRKNLWRKPTVRSARDQWISDWPGSRSQTMKRCQVCPWWHSKQDKEMELIHIWPTYSSYSSADFYIAVIWSCFEQILQCLLVQPLFCWEDHELIHHFCSFNHHSWLLLWFKLSISG